MENANRQEHRRPANGRRMPPRSLSSRVEEAAARLWRPAGTVLAVALALLLSWHVVNGKHGISIWQQKRLEDKQLQKEIDDLQQENERRQERIEKLKSDPHTIERELREKLHYAKPGEVIIDLSGDPSAQPHPSSK